MSKKKAKKKMKLDLSKDRCHCCGNLLRRNMDKLTERCVHYGCSAKNVDFSIPVKVEVEQ